MASKRRSAASTAPRVLTRDLMLDEAERLIALKGVGGFTLKDVVAPLGVQVPSVYKHYTSRDDVLVALARRYIGQLAEQFSYKPEDLDRPMSTLRELVMEYARFHIHHPAYVRLALQDFSTPDGGIEYVRLAAGGPFRENLSAGPLAAMYRRLTKLLAAGQREGEFRQLSDLDFIRIVKGSLLLRLVFPDDLLITPDPNPAVVRSVESWLWDVAYGCVARRPAPRSIRSRRVRGVMRSTNLRRARSARP